MRLFLSRVVLCSAFAIGCRHGIKQAAQVPKAREPDSHLFDSVRTRLTKEEVLAIASQAAAGKGYLLSRFQPKQVRYESMRNKGIWRVWFVMHEPTPPGGDFLVEIEDATGRATVSPGE
jgi:hypothetical protein